jgi:hypothetical protein
MNLGPVPSSASQKRPFGLPVGSRVAVGLIPTLLVVTPLVVLLRHHGYALARPEVALSMLPFAVPGLVSALCFRCRWVSGIITMAAAAIFAGIRPEPLGFLGAVALAGVGFWSVCNLTIQRIALLMAATLFLSSLVVPAATRTAPPRATAAAGSNAPFVFQLILDEHVGLPGLQAAGGDGESLGQEIRQFFADRRFALFEGAYSEYFMTKWSLSHVLNVTSGSFDSSQVEAGNDFNTFRATRNRLFESLLVRGYALRVFQSDYLDMCVTTGSVECSTYSTTDLAVLQTLPISTAGRAWVIVTTYLGTSSHYVVARAVYDGVRYELQKRGLSIPEWSWDRERINSVSSMRIVDEIEKELQRAAPGRAVVAHLLMPHYPYALDERCRVRPVADWDEHMAFRRLHANTADSKSRRYAAYVRQVRCVYSWVGQMLDAIPEPVRANSVILVHGDHGSRIVRINPDASNEPVSSADLVDGYSTLFAARAPRVGTSRTSDLVPLTCLVKATLVDEGPFADAVEACKGTPRVYRSAAGRFVPYPGHSAVLEARQPQATMPRRAILIRERS